MTIAEIMAKPPASLTAAEREALRAGILGYFNPAPAPGPDAELRAASFEGILALAPQEWTPEQREIVRSEAARRLRAAGY